LSTTSTIPTAPSHADLSTESSTELSTELSTEPPKVKVGTKKDKFWKNLYHLFPMLNISLKDQDIFTLLLLIITFPITIITSLFKVIGIISRKAIGIKIGPGRGKNDEKNTIIGDKHGEPDDSSAERYDIFYTALKKAAYNQYYNNYHNYLAQKYQFQLNLWEKEKKLFEKQTTGLFRHFRSKPEPLSERPQHPDNPARLHQFTHAEIKMLQTLPEADGFLQGSERGITERHTSRVVSWMDNKSRGEKEKLEKNIFKTLLPLFIIFFFIHVIGFWGTLAIVCVITLCTVFVSVMVCQCLEQFLDVTLRKKRG
jgi:hypothetical protein